jgi:hypothetical protein
MSEPSEPPGEGLSPVVAAANAALRKAANHLSVVFCEGDKLLFMGDLESSEIHQVCSDLSGQGRSAFDVVIAPHHGTHWHRDLAGIHAKIVAASAGRRMARHFKHGQLKAMSKQCYSTWANGSIPIALARSWNWADVHPYRP